MNTSCDTILPLITADFGTLWACKRRGKSIEVQTPFSTTSRKFVSVFITVQDSQYIVTDGGWLEDEADFYELESFKGHEEFDYYAKHYSDVHRVQVTERPGGKRVFFKTCKKSELVSALVYDVANFIASVANCVALPKVVEEDSRREAFRKQADSYVQSLFPEKVILRGHVDGVTGHRYSAIVAARPAAISLISYVTGSTKRYFGRELSAALVGFQVANRSSSKDLIRSRVALVDNKAEGYSPGRFQEDFDLLPEHRAVHVLWTENEQLAEHVYQ